MTTSDDRYGGAGPGLAAEGWQLDRMLPPSRLFGANGLRTGPDGRIYVAQVSGSQLSALDPDSGTIETVSAMGGEVVAPDDCAFDARGDLYVTEVMDARVSVIAAGGKTRVLRDDLPGANGITFHGDRLYIDECREGGRLLELDLAGGAPRVLLEDLPLPNALAPGPDGLLYFPLLGANEIWRVDPARPGAKAERVAVDLGVPVAVKFDAAGFIVSPQVGTGEVLRIDPRTGERSVLAALAPGLDNLTFVGDRLFVSNFDGRITEIDAEGHSRELLGRGLNWPVGLALDPRGGLHVADGTSFYHLSEPGRLDRHGMLFSPGYPGWIRGVAAPSADTFLVTTSNGDVARYRPSALESEFLKSGLDQLCGLAEAADGTIFVTELETGRVVALRGGAAQTVATDLNQPTGVAVASDGAVFVSEAGAGAIVEITPGGAERRFDGFLCPHGLAVDANALFVLDVRAKCLVALDRKTGERRNLASNLPVGPPIGVEPKPLRGLPPFSGPQGPFAGVALATDGSIYLSADAEGSVLRLRPQLAERPTS